jgi:hypothetical protein
LNDRTVRAFELYAIARMPAAEVAESLDLKVQDVYMAKRNVAQRLRNILMKLDLRDGSL